MDSGTDMRRAYVQNIKTGRPIPIGMGCSIDVDDYIPTNASLSYGSIALISFIDFINSGSNGKLHHPNM